MTEQNVPSREDVLRVRRWECDQRGHTWRVIEELGSRVPKAIVCMHCGAHHKIEQGQEGGSADGS